MNTKDRIKEYISYKNLNNSKFQKSIGVSGAYIQNIVNSIGADVLIAIRNKYPDLNIVWLMTGEGEMLNRSDLETIAPSPVALDNSGNVTSADPWITIQNLSELVKDQQRHIEELQKKVGNSQFVPGEDVGAVDAK